MNTTKKSIFSDCRSWSAASQSVRFAEKVRDPSAVSGLPGGLRGTERASFTCEATKNHAKSPVMLGLMEWSDTLIPIGPPSPQIRASIPAVSYMSFSTTPAR